MRFSESDIRTLLPSYLDLEHLDTLIDQAIREDIGTGDITTEWTIPVEKTAEGTFIVKESGRVAGLAVASRVFSRIDDRVIVDWTTEDGAEVRAGDRIGTLVGPVRGILIGERLALNLIQRMSGIATATAHLIQEASVGHAHILDTRKTVPGLRLLDKWSVLLGGGMNHRIGLFDMVLIKDNHIAAAGGVREAILAVTAHKARSDDRAIPVEIEAATLAEVEEIIATGGVDRILLDNMVDVLSDGTVETSRLKEAVSLIDGRFETEASGNVSADTVREIAKTGVDYISSGAITHSVRALDVSLRLELG